MKVIEDKNTQIAETVYKAQIDNGLTSYVIPKKGFTKQFAIYATHYGSNDIQFVIPGQKEVTSMPEGIAHFLEHKLFEEEGGSIFDQFSALGAQANAFTNFNMTAYLFSSTDKFFECLRLLLEFVNQPYFTDENVEKEKGIIGQEIRMYEDDPNWRVYFNLLRALYQKHPVRNDIAGTIESISSITKDMLYTCYKTFYHPSNMAVCIVGDVDPERVFDEISKYFKDKRIDKLGDTKRVYSKEPKDVNQSYVQQELAVATPLFYIGFKDNNVGEKGQNLLSKIITTRILLEMLCGKGSLLYQRLYNEGLINATFEKEYIGEVDYGFSLIGGESSDPSEVQQRVLDEIARLKNSGLNVEDFDRIKKRLAGKFLMGLDRIEGIASSYISAVFDEIDLFQYPAVLDKISFPDIEQRLNEHFDKDNCVLSVIKPKC